jgi:hypothetical protein
MSIEYIVDHTHLVFLRKTLLSYLYTIQKRILDSIFQPKYL